MENDTSRPPQGCVPSGDHIEERGGLLHDVVVQTAQDIHNIGLDAAKVAAGAYVGSKLAQPKEPPKDK